MFSEPDCTSLSPIDARELERTPGELARTLAVVLLVLAARHHEPADLLERLRLEARLAGLARELEAPLEERLRLRVVALPERREPGGEVRLARARTGCTPSEAASASASQRRPSVIRPRMLQKRTSAPASRSPSSTCPDSIDQASAARMLSFSSLEPLEPDGLPGPDQLGLGGLGELDVAAEVTVACVLELAALGEPLERVLANRLEHLEPRLALGALGLADEPVVDERGDAVQHLAELEPERRSGDGLGGLERGPADEDAEAREERLALVVEQVVAPLDRVAERLLPAAAASGTRGASRRAARRSAPASSA